MPRSALCLGSTAKEVSTTNKALEIFGEFLFPKGARTPMPALAAGEVGDHMWSKRQLGGIANLPQVREIRPGRFELTGRYIDAPILKLDKNATITADQLDLFFTRRVREAYGPFKQYCSRNGINLPLLVGVNTIDILLLSLWFDRKQLLSAFIERTKRELHEIWRTTNGNVVFLIESPMATILANLAESSLTKLIPHREEFIQWLADAFLELLRALPSGAKWGFHFCFGRVGGKAMFGTVLRKAVYSTRRTVDFSNLLFSHLAKHGFVPTFVHYPLRFGNRPPSTAMGTYGEYARIHLPQSVQIFGGAIDPSMELEKQVHIYQALDQYFGRTVGVAATCGYGSMSTREMKQSLARMHEVAHML